MPIQDIDETNVFVKFLPSNVDDVMLREWFASFGTIKSARVMIDFEKGHSLGYGFVRFSEPSEAKQAITQMSGKRYHNKTLLCKLAFCSDLPKPSTNLYIKPLPASLTESTLRRLFSSFGKIVTMRIMKNEEESKIEDILTGTGIGFVRFEDQTAATNALEKMNGYKIAKDIPPLTIKYAEYHKQQRTSTLKANSLPFIPEHAITNGQQQQFTTTTTTVTATTNCEPWVNPKESLSYNNNYYYSTDYAEEDTFNNFGAYLPTTNQQGMAMNQYGSYYYVYYVPLYPQN